MQKLLARLILSTRLATLATLREDLPQATLVAFAPASDFSAFYLHLNRLSPHAIDLQKESRLGLLIAETDDGREDPQTLARLSIRGSAEILPLGAPGYMLAKQIYLARFPHAQKRFSLSEFDLWRISPKGAYFTVGSGQTFNLTVEALMEASQASLEEE
jgi:putative heme iron utilization protein